ncbi:ectoine/hydroxyectoine ABC transporter permease subunit EhuC [Mesorhizobium sp. Root102]|uniref:ectoine/hydroxyectoine ABC transporter permease subunit EhuC n=1 Tax=Mesorhizobium sp. Root102 TaxID=1736422 RepID=UPI0006FCB6FB|nr:ectoine/hydroxyectoine ABC transporter permease subunit EhuC [Mesorhizobium sp. Root102]KQU80201.1 ectoine/hydroxyectoine ABC transporter permease subunit EhuC [Mesorhizobium sp. Root102]
MSLIYEARWVFLEGILTTIKITIAASLLAFAMAFLAGLGRLSPFAPLRWLALVYIEVFRGVALLVQLFWMFFVLPFFGIVLDPIVTAVLALGLCNGAYGAEIVRGAIKSVPHGQSEAACALNYSRQQALWKILIPQAIPMMLPPFGNLAIELLKATALVSLITVHDLSFQALTLQQTTMRTIEPFTVVLAGYFLIAIVITGLFRLAERQTNARLGRGAR